MNNPTFLHFSLPIWNLIPPSLSIDSG